MRCTRFFLITALAAFIFYCESGNTGPADTAVVSDANPHAEGFDIENSDDEAIRIADEVMSAMGGRAKWDATRYLGWNFFGRRHLLWDKKMGKVRISTADGFIYNVNVFDNSGEVMKNGALYSHPDSTKKYVERGKNIWINDSYWLVMPYKLKDSGVTLEYLGKDTTANGRTADKLQLKFKEVGVTPNNMYWVYVDDSSRLVTQWDFFTNASDEKARFSTPWDGYTEFGNILLSGDRGRGKLTDIAVYETVPDSVFTSFSNIDYSQL